MALSVDSKIKDIMNKDPITIPYDYTVEEAAEAAVSTPRCRNIRMASHCSRFEAPVSGLSAFPPCM